MFVSSILVKIYILALVLVLGGGKLKLFQLPVG